jgi:HEAT repeat protein
MVLPTLARFAAGTTAALAFTAALCAHGGQFRGPSATAQPPSPGPPAPGGPMGGMIPPPAPLSGPTTGGRPWSSDGTSWQVWWEFAKDPWLIEAPLQTGPVSGSDEYFLGTRRADAARDVMAPTEVDRHDRIADALLRAIRADRSRDVATACLVALAKVGIDPPGARLVDVFTEFIADGDQEVRETAVLAFGIAGRKEGLDTLIELLDHTPLGRKLVGGADVSERTRTFAAWSLGLVAQRSRDVAVEQRVHDVLLRLLLRPDERDRDLRVGLINALGLLSAPGARSAAETRLCWQTVGELLDYYGRDFGKGDQLVQAHVPTALARLLGRGDSPEHRKVKAVFAAELTGTAHHNPLLGESAAIALGLLCLPPEKLAEDAQFAQALLHGWQHATDQLLRYQAALALGRIGGDSNRKTLLGIYEHSNRNIERPWVALALGVLAHQRRGTDSPVDAELGRLLLGDVQTIENGDAQSAFALALGLVGYTEAAPVLERMFGQVGNETLEGYLAVALALLDARGAGDAMVARMQRSVHRPFVLLQCALALGRLGDARTVPTLLEMLGRADSTAALAAIATALIRIGDRRCIDPLMQAALATERTKLARAFAAAALGGIGDKDPIPWNSQIAAETNYMAAVDTLTNGATGVLDIL